MEREIGRLADEEFDVLVVGGGVLGAFVAWDAASRGYRVGLVERGDFAGGTSWNSLKIVHGGLRYLRSLDLRRVRESIRERSVWLRIAPHLVEPLPLVLGAFRGSLQNRGTLGAAMAAADAVGWDRNRGLPPGRRLPRGRILSPGALRRRVPELARLDVTGGALFHDARMYSAERLVLEVLEAAAREGAALANYARFDAGLGTGGDLRGARVTDRESGERLAVRARMVVNAAGPASGTVAARLTGSPPPEVPPYSLALNLVVDSLGHEVGFGVPMVPPGRDPGEVSVRATRQLFVVPWRGRSLVGTGHFPLPGRSAGPHGDGATGDRSPDGDALPDLEPHVEQFLAAVNRSLPGAGLTRDDVRLVHAGLLPVEDGDGSGPEASGEVPLLRRRRVVDHADRGTPGALTGVSVKFTTARLLARELVDRAAARLGGAVAGCRTDVTPLPGARDGDVAEVRREARSRWGARVPDPVLEHLVRSYGGRCHEVLRVVEEAPENGRRLSRDSPAIRAQLVHGVEREMARRPEDLVDRRTEIGAVGAPAGEARREARRVLAARTPAATGRR